MAGSVFDLSKSHILLPRFFIVDTNIIVERLLGTEVDSKPTSDPVGAKRVETKWIRSHQFFQRLRSERATGFVTPTVYSELVHVAIRLQFMQLGANQQPRMTSREAYKRFPEFLKTIEPQLQHLKILLIVNGLRFIPPSELSSLPNTNNYDDHLIATCCRYGIDTGDAQILIEAQQLGIDSIISMDFDMQRAKADFDIYAWP